MIIEMILFSLFAGITIFLGGLFANYFNHHIEDTPVKYEITHGMMSFGGGILLSAIALVLVPKGMELLDVYTLSISFIAGALTFYGIDKKLSKSSSKHATLLAMLMDFIPESIALGAMFVVDHQTALLLAVFIGLQNFPESFNAYRDMVMGGQSAKQTIAIFFGLSFFGVIGSLFGFYVLNDFPQVTAILMTFASGGILYLMFQDIAPESKLKGTFGPSLGATLGFLVGLIGEKVI